MLKEQSLLYKSGVFALVCIGILALSYIWFMFSAKDDMNKRTLPSQGKGEVTVKANKAKITSTFEFEGKTADEASKGLAAKLNEVKLALDREGVKDDMRKTQVSSNDPKYEECQYNPTRPTPCPSNPKIIGYISTQVLEITFDVKEGDKTQVERVLGLMPNLGAKFSSGPDFVVDNKEAVKEARILAVKDAREKAEIIAKALGMRLGEVMYYSENNGANYPMPMYSAKNEMRSSDLMVAQAPAAVPVEIGSDKVSVTVDITYELK